MGIEAQGKMVKQVDLDDKKEDKVVDDVKKVAMEGVWQGATMMMTMPIIVLPYSTDCISVLNPSYICNLILICMYFCAILLLPRYHITDLISEQVSDFCFGHRKWLFLSEEKQWKWLFLTLKTGTSGARTENMRPVPK